MAKGGQNELTNFVPLHSSSSSSSSSCSDFVPLVLIFTERSGVCKCPSDPTFALQQSRVTILPESPATPGADMTAAMFDDANVGE